MFFKSLHLKKVELTKITTAAPEKLISAFLEQEMLAVWWNVERCLIEKKTGGIYALAWNINESGFGYISSGIISQFEPTGILKVEKLVYFNPGKQILGPMELTVRAERKGAGTELYLCQDGYQDHGDWIWYYDAVRQAWPVVAEKLTNYVESL